MKSIESKLLRSFFMSLLAFGVSMAVVSCESSDMDDTETGTGSDSTEGSGSSGSDWADPEGVISWIDETLNEVYLYNEEYSQIENKDYTLAFDDFFYDNLESLTTNVLDYKLYDDGEKYLFSYIEATAPDGTTRSTTRSSSKAVTDFGFVYMTPVYDSTGTLGLYILACYNDSPVDELGICRGMVIVEIDGQEITASNYNEYIYKLLYPSAGDSYSLKLYIYGENSQTLTVTTKTYDANPVLNCEIIDEANKVGYLNYVLFESLYDSELLSAFETLRIGGVESLILDLRYNLGGYVSSASKMVSAIAGISTDSSQVFQYYRFNDTLTLDYSDTMGWTGLGFDPSQSLFYEMLTGVSSSYQLALTSNTIYVLVGYNTASASEMVINQLRAMGYDVVLIGQTTRGKNVGMFVFEERFEGYEYEMVPISFENFNSLGEGGYEAGFDPDYYISQSDEMVGFKDYSKDETLIATALSLIDGTYRATSPGRSVDASGDVTPLGSVVMSGGKVQGAMMRVER